MSVLRFLMLLSLAAWIGGLIFFVSVLAPTAFNPDVLPSTHLAGNVVAKSLSKMHWIAFISGIVYLISSITLSQFIDGTPHAFSLRNLLVGIMLLLTAVSQFGIIPRMARLRAAVADMSAVPLDNPLRMQFDALHHWSTRVEGTVLLLGLIVVYLTAGALSQR